MKNFVSFPWGALSFPSGVAQGDLGEKCPRNKEEPQRETWRKVATFAYACPGGAVFHKTKASKQKKT